MNIKIEHLHVVALGPARLSLEFTLSHSIECAVVINLRFSTNLMAIWRIEATDLTAYDTRQSWEQGFLPAYPSVYLPEAFEDRGSANPLEAEIMLAGVSPHILGFAESAHQAVLSAQGATGESVAAAMRAMASGAEFPVTGIEGLIDPMWAA